MKRLLCTIVTLSAACLPAQSQTANLVAGEVRLAIGAVGDYGVACYVGRGAAFFQRNGTDNRAYVSFAELTGPGYRDLSGQTWLTFSSATAGFIRFKEDAAIPSAPFRGYSQNYNATYHRLTVKFTIKFTGCDLPIVATFDGA